jgi:hypothetical protein
MLCKEKEKIHGWMVTSESVSEGILTKFAISYPTAYWMLF